MRRITANQFGWSTAFLTLGCVLWLLPGDVWLNCAPGCLVVSTLIVMSREERTRPLPIRHAVGMFAALALVIGAVVLSHRVIPAQWGKPVLRILRDPALVVPVWTTMILLSYRQRRHGKVETHAA
jgi:hypothetical protein